MKPIKINSKDSIGKIVKNITFIRGICLIELEHESDICGNYIALETTTDYDNIPLVREIHNEVDPFVQLNMKWITKNEFDESCAINRKSQAIMQLENLKHEYPEFNINFDLK